MAHCQQINSLESSCPPLAAGPGKCGGARFARSSVCRPRCGVEASGREASRQSRGHRSAFRPAVNRSLGVSRSAVSHRGQGRQLDVALQKHNEPESQEADRQGTGRPGSCPIRPAGGTSRAGVYTCLSGPWGHGPPKLLAAQLQPRQGRAARKTHFFAHSLPLELKSKGRWNTCSPRALVDADRNLPGWCRGYPAGSPASSCEPRQTRFFLPSSRRPRRTSTGLKTRHESVSASVSMRHANRALGWRPTARTREQSMEEREGAAVRPHQSPVRTWSGTCVSQCKTCTWR